MAYGTLSDDNRFITIDMNPAASTNEAGKPVDQFGNPITKQDVRRIPVDEFGWYVDPRMPEMQTNINTGYFLPLDVKADANTVGEPMEKESGWLSNPFSSFLYKGSKAIGKAIDDSVEIVIPAAAIAILAYAGGAVASGLLAGEGAAGGAVTVGAADAAALSSEATALVESGAISAADAATLGGYGLGESMMGGIAEGAALGEQAAAGFIAQAAAAANTSLSATEAAAAAAKLKAAADAAAAAGEVWTVQNYLNAANLALTAGTTIAAIAGGGDQEVSTTDTKDVTGPGILPFPAGDTGSGAGTPPGFTPTGTDTTGKTAGAVSFEDFINDFYGLTGGTSAQARGVEDQAALQGFQQQLMDSLTGLDATRLTDTRAAVKPYQDQLADIQGQLTGNRGLGKQISFGFGGKPMASFVPKPNRDLANQVLGMGREGSEISTGLVDMGYKAGTDQAGRQFGFQSENLPNKAADNYTAKLMELMKYFNPTGSTETTTGNVPGVPWYTTAMQGLTSGVNLWDKINNPRKSTGVQLKQNADGTFSVVGG